mmetsp:Transcript_86845/g.246281  ORF Transcript_86845/g.246281 Transcript_86845/m.246281 type:complete len:202 (-) Transcript_86845:844-1449(-)
MQVHSHLGRSSSPVKRRPLPARPSPSFQMTGPRATSCSGAGSISSADMLDICRSLGSPLSSSPSSSGLPGESSQRRQGNACADAFTGALPSAHRSPCWSSAATLVCARLRVFGGASFLSLARLRSSSAWARRPADSRRSAARSASALRTCSSSWRQRASESMNCCVTCLMSSMSLTSCESSLMLKDRPKGVPRSRFMGDVP